MSLDTRKIAGRRRLAFEDFDDVIADAAKLVAGETRMLGNWPLERLLLHLAHAINGSIDGIEVKAPWYVRLLGPSFKDRILQKGMPAGFGFPERYEAALFPAAGTPQSALDKLRSAVARLEHERMSAPHPVFGILTHEQWIQLHLRHAELHLSFAVPAGTDVAGDAGEEGRTD